MIARGVAPFDLKVGWGAKMKRGVFLFRSLFNFAMVDNLNNLHDGHVCAYGPSRYGVTECNLIQRMQRMRMR